MKSLLVRGTLGAGVSVQFEVVDAEKLLPCRFANFVWFSQEDLIVALRSRVPLFSGEAAPGRSQLEQIRSALEAILKERGIGGHVTFEMEGNAAGKGGRVVFAVEGIPIFVREVELPGANAINRETLARLTGAVVGGNYDPALIGTFLVANLKLEYGDRGYLKATLEAPTAELIKHDGPETWVKLILPVKEGPQYRLAAIHWTGNNVFTEPDLAKRFGLKPGDIANQGLFEKGEATVQRLYATRGYARARLEALPTFDDDQHTVGYEMRIEQGSLYRMGRLTITGLDAPTTARLENVCRLAPGQVYDRDYWACFHLTTGKRGLRSKRILTTQRKRLM